MRAISLLAAGIALLVAAGPWVSRAGSAPAAGTLDDFPLYFIENRGQVEGRLGYYLEGREASVYFSPAGLTYLLKQGRAEQSAAATPQAVSSQERPGPFARWAVKLDFVGANPHSVPEGSSKTPAVVSYFKGPAGANQTGLATFREITYRNLWPGIDLAFSGTVNRLKYEFVVRPGADPNNIRLAYRGADVALNNGGQLEIATPLGGFRDDKPYAYQQRGGREVAVPAGYSLIASEADGRVGYSFALGDYDPSLPLVIDPSVLIYAGYIGGTSLDAGNDVAVDVNGNAYVTGETASGAGFPATAGPDLTFNGDTDAFVAKVNAAGTALVYAGYIGGAAADRGASIAVDGAGNAYITGKTSSPATSFPVRTGPDLTFNGASDAFVAKVNAAGTALLYAGYIGGNAVDSGNGIAVDGAGNAYITGETLSNEFSFPVKIGPDLTSNGGQDGFVAKVNAAGTALVFAGYIGGNATDSGHDIAVTGDGDVFITGETGSGEATFPVTVGPDVTYNGGPTDAFVTKIRADGTAFTYAGYIGGALADAGNGIAVDLSGQAHVTGNTSSTETTFPVLRGPDLTHNGGQDAFAAKVAAGGATLIHAGYVGGSALDSGVALALDADGNAYITGGTLSSEATFPVTGGDDRAVFSGARDAYVAQINPAGSTLTYAGYIGGDADDRGEGIAVGPGGAVYIAGQTTSAAATFPATVGPDLTLNGGRDAFVVKIEITGPSITLEGIVNAATYIGGPLAPGEIISIFGVGIGPEMGANGTFDENGHVGTLLAGVQVLINGVPAPLYFANEHQINCQVPYEVDGSETVTVQVIFEGAASNIVTIGVADTAPGLFTLENGVGQVIAVLFPEATLNSAENPVGPGQIVTLYGTGEGQTNPASETGVPVDANALPIPIADVVVTIGGIEQDILYVGGAPGFAGLLQINVRIVAGTPTGPAVPIVVTIGGVNSAALTPEKGAGEPDGQVTIAIVGDPENQGPVANAQTVMTDEDTAAGITLTGSDPEGDPLTFTVTRNPSNGVLSVLNPLGPGSAAVTYTPVQDFNGNDSFDFRVMDPNGGNATATVTIQVKPLPDPPVANNDVATAVEETLTVIDVLRNDYDPDGDDLIVSSVETPANGATSTNGATVSYTPNAGFDAIESFDYTISDQTGKALATARVTVRVVNAPPAENQDPIANAQNVMTPGNVPLPITLSGSDPDDDSLTFSITVPPTNGTLGAIMPLGPETAAVTYTPDTGYDGPDSFTFQADDGEGGAATAVVSITVKPVDADLVITKTLESASVTAGGQVTYTLKVTNNGPSPASGVVVTDAFPAELSHSSNTCGAAPGAGSVTWNVGGLAADAMATCMVTFDVNPAATANIENLATVTGNEPDSNSANNMASTDNPVVLDVALAVSKSVVGDFRLGMTADYLVVVSHVSGTSNANNVQVADTLDPLLTFVPAGSSMECMAAMQTVTCTAPGPVAPGGSAMFTIQVMVGSAP